MIVDDNQYARSLATANLKHVGIHKIEEAHSGGEALLRLHGGGFDALLIDWYMPEISGAGILSVVRDKRFGAAYDIPIIVMSAYTNRENVERAMDLGADDVVSKPIKASAIATSLANVVAKRSQRKSATPPEYLDELDEDQLDQHLSPSEEQDTAFL